MNQTSLRQAMPSAGNAFRRLAGIIAEAGSKNYAGWDTGDTLKAKKILKVSLRRD